MSVSRPPGTGEVPLLPPEIRRGRLLAWRRIEVVLDVGANKGQFGTRIRDAGYQGRIVSFEPLSAACEELMAVARRDPRWECHRIALGARAGRVRLNVSGDLEASSVLGMEDRHVRHCPASAYVGVETVEMVAIDDIRGSLLLGTERVYLKLDVQGYELEVLLGGATLLPQVELVETELSLVPLYCGGPLYREVVDHLDERRCQLISVEGITEEPASGHMLQVDAVFARLPSGAG